VSELDVQIPSKAVSEDADVLKPVRALLEDLNLLGTPAENEKAGTFAATFNGPPQSVALIEAGATAASKWWAASLGATVAATWVSVAGWWGNQAAAVQTGALGGAALVTAAVAVAIGYLIASDVRGRGAAAVAVIEARSSLATAMLLAAERVYEPEVATNATVLVPLPNKMRVTKLSGKDTQGWLAVAVERQADGEIKYVIVKGSAQETVSISDLDFS
jgi:hypothetical protein